MNSFDDIYDPYSELEMRVRELMASLFSATCGSCTACCCRVDICEEVIQSRFLSVLLKKQKRNADELDDRYGWLNGSGCTLEYGKPPICYAYFCDQLLYRLPDDETRFVTQVLGKLMYHIGQNALNEWHLTEIMNPADLLNVDINSISDKLEEAQDAFEVIQNFFDSGRLTASDHQILEQITTEEP